VSNSNNTSYSEQSVVVKISSSNFKKNRKRKSSSSLDDGNLLNIEKKAESAPPNKRRKIYKRTNNIEKPPWNSSTNLHSLSALSRSSEISWKSDKISNKFALNKDIKHEPNFKKLPEKEINQVNNNKLDTKKDFLRKKQPLVLESNTKKSMVAEEPQTLFKNTNKNTEKTKIKKSIKESSQHSLKIKLAINNQKPKENLENNNNLSGITEKQIDNKSNFISSNINVDVSSKKQSKISNKNNEKPKKSFTSAPKQNFNNFNMSSKVLNEGIDMNKSEFKANVQVSQNQTKSLNKKNKSKASTPNTNLTNMKRPQKFKEESYEQKQQSLKNNKTITENTVLKNKKSPSYLKEESSDDSFEETEGSQTSVEISVSNSNNTSYSEHTRKKAGSATNKTKNFQNLPVTTNDTAIKIQTKNTISNKKNKKPLKTFTNAPKQNFNNFNTPTKILNKSKDMNKSEFKAKVQVSQKQTESLNKKNKSKASTSNTKIGLSLSKNDTKNSHGNSTQRKLKFDLTNLDNKSKAKSETNVQVKSKVLNRSNARNTASQRTENFKLDVGIFADADKQIKKNPKKSTTAQHQKSSTQETKLNQVASSSPDKNNSQFKSHKTQTNHRSIDVLNFYHPYQRLGLRKENPDFIGLIDQIRADLRQSLKLIRQQKNSSDQIRMFKELISKYIPTENEIPTQTSDTDAIDFLTLKEGLSTNNDSSKNHENRFTEESIIAMTKILESFQKSSSKDNKVLSSLHPVLTSRGLELMPSEDGITSFGPKRPVPFEGSYDLMTKRYEPLLMSNPAKLQKKTHTYRVDPFEVKFNFLPNRHEKILTYSYRSGKKKLKTSSSSFRKFFRDNHRRSNIVRQNKTSLNREEAKLRELASIRLKEKQYEAYLNEKNKVQSYTRTTKLPPIRDDEVRRRDNLSAVERNPILGFLGENTLKHTSIIRPIIEQACDMTESEEHILKQKEFSKSIRKEAGTR